MIQSVQKVIKIGTSGGVTIPAKELKRQNINFGDEVEVTIKPLKKSAADQTVLDAARKLLTEYHQDFQNLKDR